MLEHRGIACLFEYNEDISLNPQVPALPPSWTILTITVESSTPKSAGLETEAGRNRNFSAFENESLVMIGFHERGFLHSLENLRIYLEGGHTAFPCAILSSHLSMTGSSK